MKTSDDNIKKILKDKKKAKDKKMKKKVTFNSQIFIRIIKNREEMRIDAKKLDEILKTAENSFDN